MKKFCVALLLCLSLIPALCGNADGDFFVRPPVYGVGVQKLGAGWGISGTADIDDRLAGQAVLGPFGDMHIYAGRALYSFYRRMDWRIYAFGQAAYLRHRHAGGSARDTSLSLGAGVGVEYDWRRDFPELLPLFWNLELGLMTDSLEHRSISGLRIGAGVHYRF